MREDLFDVIPKLLEAMEARAAFQQGAPPGAERLSCSHAAWVAYKIAANKKIGPRLRVCGLVDPLLAHWRTMRDRGPAGKDASRLAMCSLMRLACGSLLESPAQRARLLAGLKPALIIEELRLSLDDCMTMAVSDAVTQSAVALFSSSDFVVAVRMCKVGSAQHPLHCISIVPTYLSSTGLGCPALDCF